MRVSVVIPTYNRSRLVCEAVDSVLAQRCGGAEILVVDDGSTDDTAAALRQYGDRIRYLPQGNRGVNAARNRALAEARGEFVALLDSDDLWLPFKLGLQTDILARLPGVGFLFTEFFILKPDGSRIPGGLRSWHSRHHRWAELYAESHALASLCPTGLAGSPGGGASVHVGDIYRQLLVEPHVLPSTALIRRSCLDPDLRFVESDSTCGDWDLFARLSHRHGAAFLDLETTLNRSHEDEVRLTRVSAALQTSRRVEMIERVWKSDPSFLAGHREEAERVQATVLLALAKLLLLDGDSRGARLALRRLSCLRSRRRSWRELAFGAAARLPGGAAAMRLARGGLQALRAPRAAGSSGASTVASP